MKQQLSDTEVYTIRKKIALECGQAELIAQGSRVELIDNQTLLVNDEPLFFHYGNRWAPTIKLLTRSNFLRSVVVGKLQVHYVVEGSDVDRAWLIDINDEILQGEIISVCEEKDKHVIAVGEAKMSGREIRLATKGTMVKIIHYMNDRIFSI